MESEKGGMGGQAETEGDKFSLSSSLSLVEKKLISHYFRPRGESGIKRGGGRKKRKRKRRGS